MLSKTIQRIVYAATLLLSTYPLSAQWMQPNGPWGGQVYNLAVNKGTVFAGTYGGIFISTDNGDGWTKCNNCPIEGVVTFAVKDSAVYAGSFGALFVTRDNGKNWTDLSAGLPEHFELFTLAIKGDTLFAGFDDDPIHYSTDNGLTWKNTDQLMTTFHLWVYQGNLFAAGNIGIYRSVDDGKTWDATDSVRRFHAFTVVDTAILAGTDLGIIRSLDRGVTWERYGEGISEFPISEATITGFDVVNGLVFAASPRGVYISADKGANWTLSNSGLSNQQIGSMAVNGSVIFAGSSPRGVFRSLDSGATWKNAVRGMSSLTITDLIVSGDLIAAGCNGGIMLSYDAGKNWQWADISRNIYILSIVKKNDVILAGTAGSGMFRSLDNGKHWTCIDSSSGYFELLTIGNGGFFGKIRDTVLMYSIDSGATWVAKLTEHAIGAFMVNGDTITVGAWKALHRSTDNGNTWVKYDTTGLVNYKYPDNFLQVDTVLFAAGYMSGVSRSNDNGIHWTSKNTGLDDTNILSLAAYGTTLFAGTAFHGVYQSTNNGESWTSASAGSGISSDYIKTLAANNTTLYAGTGGSGLWERQISDIIGSIDRNIRPANAKRLDFRTFSPRAANNNATLVFSLSRTEQVSVKVFDISGREVALIVNAQHNPGSYRYQWNTAKFRAGCYIAQIKAGSNKATGAITVMQ